MKILAIETSCDETAAAVVQDGTKILSNVVASSTAMHEKYGGIVPEVAAREQLKCIIPVITEALSVLPGKSASGQHLQGVALNTLLRMKGEGRPVHSQMQRKEMLEALSCVDEVIELPPMNTHQEYYDLVMRLRPAIIAITEGDPLEANKREQAAKAAAELAVIPKIPTPSTSQLAKLLGLE